MIIFITYIAPLLIGAFLGLFGGGGSILTVPVLVYLLGLPPLTATAYSLFIVGSSAMVGALRFLVARQIDLSIALVFALPSFLAVFVTRRLLVPALPETLLQLGEVSIQRDVFIMTLFALLMLAASYSMIRSRPDEIENPAHEHRDDYEDSSPDFHDQPDARETSSKHGPRPLLITLNGFLVGFLTGLVGAGGGFMIIPVLVFFVGLPIKKAVGTSLLIVSVNSTLGFLGDLGGDAIVIDWKFLALFAGLTWLGILAGAFLNRRLNENRLRPLFGWFILFIGVLILCKEFLFEKLL